MLRYKSLFLCAALSSFVLLGTTTGCSVDTEEPDENAASASALADAEKKVPPEAANISKLIDKYYFGVQNGHRGESFILDWGNLWATDAVMEDPLDAAFGKFVGRPDITNRLRVGYQTLFAYIDMKPQNVVIQWTEHRASVLWHLDAKYLNIPEIPADKRGKKVKLYGITNFKLDSTDTQIVHQSAIWDYTVVF